MRHTLALALALAVAVACEPAPISIEPDPDGECPTVVACGPDNVTKQTCTTRGVCMECIDVGDGFAWLPVDPCGITCDGE